MMPEYQVISEFVRPSGERPQPGDRVKLSQEDGARLGEAGCVRPIPKAKTETTTRPKPETTTRPKPAPKKKTRAKAKVKK